MAEIFRKAWRRFGSSGIRDGQVCSGKSSGVLGDLGDSEEADGGVGLGPGGPPHKSYRRHDGNAETNLGAAGTSARATSGSEASASCIGVYTCLLRLWDDRGCGCAAGDFLW